MTVSHFFPFGYDCKSLFHSRHAFLDILELNFSSPWFAMAYIFAASNSLTVFAPLCCLSNKQGKIVTWQFNTTYMSHTDLSFETSCQLNLCLSHCWFTWIWKGVKSEWPTITAVTAFLVVVDCSHHGYVSTSTSKVFCQQGYLPE